MAKERREMLTLKNNVRVDALRAIAEVVRLSDLRVTEPEHFQSLLQLARGAEETSVPPEHLHALKGLGFVDHQNEEIHFVTQQVLLAACRETAEGVVVDNPFALADQREQVIYREQVKIFNRNLGDLLSGNVDDEDDDTPPARGR